MATVQATTIATGSREEWLAARRQGIGASDAATVLGLSPWKTPLQLFLDKRGLLPEQETLPRMAWGLRWERLIAEAYTEATGRTVRRPGGMYRHPQFPWVLATLDFETEGDCRPVEVKKVNQNAAYVREFGEPGTDEVPEFYYLQTQQQMEVTGADSADLAALIGDDDFRIYTIPRNQPVIDRLIEAEREFMDRVARNDPPMPDFEHPTTAEILSLIEPVAGKSIDLPDELLALVEEYQSLGGECKSLEDRRKAVKSRLLHAVGDAEIGRLSDGRYIQRKTVKRDGYEVKPTQYVDFRIKTPKTKKGKSS